MNWIRLILELLILFAVPVRAYFQYTMFRKYRYYQSCAGINIDDKRIDQIFGVIMPLITLYILSYLGAFAEVRSLLRSWL